MFKDTLLKISRKYTKDECVAILQKALSDAEFKIGELKSERDELSAQLYAVKNTVIIEGAKTKKQWVKDDLIALLNEQLKHAKKINKDLQASLSEWRNKYLSIQAKNNTPSLKH